MNGGLGESLTGRKAVDAADNHNLLNALAGKAAAQDCAAAYRTRRVVLASLGVMQEQKASRKRHRAVAMAALLLMVMALGPFAWHLVDEIFEGEHISDIAAQISLGACILCPAILAAALMAGWMRKRS